MMVEVLVMSVDYNQNPRVTPDNCRELPLAFPYVPMQCFQNRYSDEDAIIRGTLFPELDLPFKDYIINSPLIKTPKTELMKVHFVCLELRLYLDTHPDDKNALEYYKHYRKKFLDLKEKFDESQEQGTLNSWVYNPWPWEGQEA